MGISPLGYQNNIQNPLAAVMYAIMNGAFDNAKDARRTDYQIAQDREQQRNRDLDRALQVALQGGRVTDPTLGQDPLVRAATGVGSGRLQNEQQDRDMRAREQNRIAAESAQRMRMAQDSADRDAANDSAHRAATWSNIANTWADNAGAVGKFFLGGAGRSDRNVQTVHDANTGDDYQIVNTTNGVVKRKIPMDGQASPGVVVPPSGPNGGGSGDALANELEQIRNRIRANGATRAF